MTNDVARYFVRDLDPTNELERGRPCFVHHEDAGGRCERTATMLVYGLAFCREHGTEARIGAEMEAFDDAEHYFDRLRNPHVPSLNHLVDGELAAVVGRMRDEGPTDADHYRALRLAYPDAPERVRSIVRRWERDERADGHGVSPIDQLLDGLRTLHKLVRIAHDDAEHWLVEILELEREALAAQAAFALEGHELVEGGRA
jgi:hypothetical protein